MFRTIDTSISASCLILWHTQAEPHFVCHWKPRDRWPFIFWTCI